MDFPKFKIGASTYFIEIKLNMVLGFPHETDFDGGYMVNGEVSIQSGKYCVNNAELWFTTGQVYQLFQQLKEAYKKLKGHVIFSTRGDSIYFEMDFNHFGQIDVKGYFQEFPSIDNRLEFEFQLDQSYLLKTLEELKNIVDVYGGMSGIKE